MEKNKTNVMAWWDAKHVNQRTEWLWSYFPHRKHLVNVKFEDIIDSPIIKFFEQHGNNK